MAKKQTAVEWLVEKSQTQDWYTYKQVGFIEQAKATEKQQIIDARLSLDNSDNIWDKKNALEMSEHYYKETYGKEGGER